MVISCFERGPNVVVTWRLWPSCNDRLLLVSRCSLAVLLVRDLFHPLDRRAVELFLDGDVGHGGGGGRAVPVLFARRDPNHVTGADLLLRPAPSLHPAAAGRHDQRLSERVGVPGGAGTWLE